MPVCLHACLHPWLLHCVPTYLLHCHPACLPTGLPPYLLSCLPPCLLGWSEPAYLPACLHCSMPTWLLACLLGWFPACLSPNLHSWAPACLPHSCWLADNLTSLPACLPTYLLSCLILHACLPLLNYKPVVLPIYMLDWMLACLPYSTCLLASSSACVPVFFPPKLHDCLPPSRVACLPAWLLAFLHVTDNISLISTYKQIPVVFTCQPHRNLKACHQLLETRLRKSHVSQPKMKKPPRQLLPRMMITSSDTWKRNDAPL